MLFPFHMLRINVFICPLQLTDHPHSLEGPDVMEGLRLRRRHVCCRLHELNVYAEPLAHRLRHRSAPAHSRRRRHISKSRSSDWIQLVHCYAMNKVS